MTLSPPTQPMRAEAASSGFYTALFGAAFPKLQILTVEGLLAGTDRARYPDLSLGSATFKKAKREEKTDTQTALTW